MSRAIGIMALALIISAFAGMAQEKKGMPKPQQTCDLKTNKIEWVNNHKAFKKLSDALSALSAEKLDDKEFGFDEITRTSGLANAKRIVSFKEQFETLVAEIASTATRECGACKLKPIYESAKKGGFGNVTWADLRDEDLRLLFVRLGNWVDQRNSIKRERANITDRVKLGQLDREIEEIEERIRKTEAETRSALERANSSGARPEERFAVTAENTVCK